MAGRRFMHRLAAHTRRGLGAAALCIASLGAFAQAPAPANSGLDAPLFYQLLIGEIELRGGNAGTAYEVLLDAARRTKDETLFRRAMEVALQARAGQGLLGQCGDGVKRWGLLRRQAFNAVGGGCGDGRQGREALHLAFDHAGGAAAREQRGGQAK